MWAPVVGFEGLYEVSSEGRVRGLERKGADGRRVRSRELPGTLCGSTGARLAVTLSSSSGAKVRRYIHHLVLEAFVGPRPQGMVGRHADDQAENNALSNLSWGTVSENNYDLVANGKHVNASKTHCPKGHPYAVRWGKNGGRRCKECEQARWAKRKDERMKKKNEGARG